MTSLLAIDAATEACSVALSVAGEQREDFRLAPRAHTRLMLPMVDALMQEAGVELQQLDAIAFSAGPGSFTGLRVACAVVQGLAFAAELPVLPISTLQLLAQQAIQRHGLDEGDLVHACLDARMNEVYWGQYRVVAGQAVAICADQLLAPTAVRIDRQQAGRQLGVGSGWCYRQEFQLAKAMDHLDQDLLPRAAALLPLAQQKWLRGEQVNADQAQPVYLRDSVAWQKSG